MNCYIVRVYMSESRWYDLPINSDTWFNAESTGKGISPVGRAVFLRGA